MKEAFVHRARIILHPDADGAAPGGAVTIALCGSWDHAGPCRWPHQSNAQWDGPTGELRVVFVAEAHEVLAIRELIDQALRNGQCIGPDGEASNWTLQESSAGVLSPEERELAARMARPE